MDTLPKFIEITHRTFFLIRALRRDMNKNKTTWFSPLDFSNKAEFEEKIYGEPTRTKTTSLHKNETSYI